MKISNLFIIVICLSSSIVTLAQQYATVYQCGFEASENTANWYLTDAEAYIEAGSEHISNLFFTGSAVAYTGQKSLYISENEGVENTIKLPKTLNQIKASIADLNIQLPAGNYQISFDYIMKNPQSVNIIFVNDRFDGYLIANKSIPYSNEWQNTIFTINLNQEAQWVNITYISSFNASEPTIDAFAIDNIVIKKEVVQSGDYNIHIAATQNGSVTANTYLAAEGETITLAPAPNSGYELESLTVSKAGGGAVEVSSNQFVMPADNVVVTATFKPIQSGTEQISAESLSVFVNNRTVSVENAAAEVFISDIGGRIVAQGAGSGEYEVAQAGVYIVRAGAAVRKVVVK